MSNFETIDSALLVTATGGAGAAAPQQQGPEDGPPTRTWGQVARDYAGACVQGAGQSLVFGGRPRSWREGLTNAALGCAMGVGMRAVEDVSNAVSGNGG